jgi:hypothetical protein
MKYINPKTQAAMMNVSAMMSMMRLSLSACGIDL